MKGRIRPDEKIAQLLAVLDKARKDKGLEPPRKMKIYKGDPELLNDEELIQAFDELRKERAALAKKLVDDGILEPTWDQGLSRSKTENKI
jgi:hypothetical protein